MYKPLTRGKITCSENVTHFLIQPHNAAQSVLNRIVTANDAGHSGVDRSLAFCSVSVLVLTHLSCPHPSGPQHPRGSIIKPRPICENHLPGKVIQTLQRVRAKWWLLFNNYFIHMSSVKHKQLSGVLVLLKALTDAQCSRYFETR